MGTQGSSVRFIIQHADRAAGGGGRTRGGAVAKDWDGWTEDARKLPARRGDGPPFTETRRSLALAQFCTAFRQLRDADSAELAATFAGLLKDKETEVRLTAVGEVEAVARGCGAATFSDVAFRLPKSTRQGGATTLTFRAPGLVDVTIAFDVWPGDASSLEVVVPSAFDGSLDGVGLKSSTYALVAGVSNPFIVYVRDDAGNRLHDEDTSTRTVTVAVVDDTDTVVFSKWTEQDFRTG